MIFRRCLAHVKVCYFHDLSYKIKHQPNIYEGSYGVPQKITGKYSMFGKGSPSIQNTNLQEIDRIAKYGQDLRFKTPVAEVGEECDQRKGKMCKPNFILVEWFVGLPSQTLGIALVKYKMTGKAEETDNPNGGYGNSI